MVTLNASFKRAHMGTSDLKFELSNKSSDFCLGENYKLVVVVTFLGRAPQTSVHTLFLLSNISEL